MLLEYQHPLPKWYVICIGVPYSIFSTIANKKTFLAILVQVIVARFGLR